MGLASVTLVGQRRFGLELARLVVTVASFNRDPKELAGIGFHAYPTLLSELRRRAVSASKLSSHVALGVGVCRSSLIR